MSNTLKDYRIWCLLVALIAMLVLFIYPSKQQKNPTYSYTFIIDITRSMNATDYQQDNQSVSRLHFVKQTLRELLRELPCQSKIGLGLFTERRSTLLFEPLEGLRFVRSRPVILGAISLDLFAVLLGGATALLPAYASDVLHVDAAGLGLLRTAPGAGAALTAVILGFVPISRRVGRWMFGGVLLFGAATVLFGLSVNFQLSMVALVLMGAGDMVSVYIRHMLVQLETPDAIRGRVSAVNSVFIGASNELGEFESGLTAAWFGLVPAVVIGGIATLAVTALCVWKFPVLRNMDRFPVAFQDSDKRQAESVSARPRPRNKHKIFYGQSKRKRR